MDTQDGANQQKMRSKSPEKTQLQGKAESKLLG